MGITLFIVGLLFLIVSFILLNIAKDRFKDSQRMYQDARSVYKRSKMTFNMSLEMVKAHSTGDKETVHQCQAWFQSEINELTEEIEKDK